MNFKVLKSDILFEGKVFDLKVDQIEYDSGNKGVREVAVHPGGAVIIPYKSDGKIVLVKQYRYPLEKELLEFPAGKLEKGEDPVLCAVRELEEETGYKSNDVIKIGAIYSAPGFCTEILHVYLATNLIAGNHNREEGEQDMKVYEYTMEELDRMVKNLELNDSKTLAGLNMLKVHLNGK